MPFLPQLRSRRRTPKPGEVLTQMLVIAALLLGIARILSLIGRW
ncbi:Uncharacterised protein [Starkeya nomas]|uniref:Uncharacterized protein n=1 Tax=Starkeya nomas TaxID=2666134 RepID=A0A5S9ND51_9HYPH|nr:Uncharacterised protein [Starkeya nomas]